MIHERSVPPAEPREEARELAIEAMLAVSRHIESGDSLTGFYRRLTASVAGLVGAEKVLFWQVNDNQTLTAIPGGYGVDDEFISRLYPAPCAPDRNDLTSRVVYRDLVFNAARDAHGDSPYRSVLDLLQVSNAISVPWRAGDSRLGLVAAYDSVRPEGFSNEDAWLLQISGLAAGLVWQLKQAEGDLRQSLGRLQVVDAGRQLLLKNLSTAVDRARRRFAAELHDDALQKLTAAELHLQRVSESADPATRVTAINEAQELLGQAEEAVRKLLFDVRPPAFDALDGFAATVRDRLALSRSLTGIEPQLELDLPDDVPYEIKSVIYRQLSEALTNVEKHAGATTVQVTVRGQDGGVHGEVVDDGRGFVVSERNHLPGHLGLLALNERALLAGGWCTVTSEPGAGARVEFWVPIPK
ncbi:MAG: sensor histidine kinase [Candidatus Dormibacterales bacterium]